MSDIPISSSDIFTPSTSESFVYLSPLDIFTVPIEESPQPSALEDSIPSNDEIKYKDYDYLIADDRDLYHMITMYMAEISIVKRHFTAFITRVSDNIDIILKTKRTGSKTTLLTLFLSDMTKLNKDLANISDEYNKIIETVTPNNNLNLTTPHAFTMIYLELYRIIFDLNMHFINSTLTKANSVYYSTTLSKLILQTFLGSSN